MLPLTSQSNDPPLIRTQASPVPQASRVVPKPVPAAQKQDPRTYQISQIRRRFQPKEKDSSDGSTTLTFKLVPSDPDFPYELASLECMLQIPKDYPAARPALRVANTDIPRGFSINIERGWAKLAEEKQGATLLALTNALDKSLEAFLSEQKVDTVKLMSFKDTRHLDAQVATAQPPAALDPPKPAVPPSRPMYRPEEAFTKQQIADAKARRAQEVRQMEARMSRLPNYRRSADGVVYTLPIEPKRRRELPDGLRAVVTLHLIVPLLYPLQDLKIQLNEAESEDAEPAEELFAEKAAAQKSMTLMSQLNYLAQNLHSLSRQAAEQRQKRKEQQERERLHREEDASVNLKQDDEHAPPRVEKGDKAHIQIIPRPPEWEMVGSDAEDSYDDCDDSADEGGARLGDHSDDSYEDLGPSHKKDGDPAAAAALTETPERGTMLSFPSVELHNIELLQISLLSLSVKCERCKTLNDMTCLKPNVPKSSSCSKCATDLSATFRAQLVHAHSTRAGFIDVSGCKVADMLPSTFLPTCGRCSTLSTTGIVSVRGESMTNVCRECHGKFTFRIPDVKFLLITPGTSAPPTMGPRRKQEKLGLHAGEPLPSRGSCAHYRKSYRWFRFSCCSKVHACDKCHDDAEEHVNEWANRMICGWCSREQNYAVEACAFCGRSVIGKKGRGFWEGGKGTRDQRMMSRKDPRKYKRLGATTASKK